MQTVHRDLKAAREEAQAQEQSFQRELSSAQKLSDMYKEMANARVHKCESLEGVLRELKTHLEVWPRLCNGGTSVQRCWIMRYGFLVVEGPMQRCRLMPPG